MNARTLAAVTPRFQTGSTAYVRTPPFDRKPRTRVAPGRLVSRHGTPRPAPLPLTDPQRARVMYGYA